MTPLEQLIVVSQRLGDLREEVVFVGGAVTSLLITDPASPPVSATKDVDIIVSVATRAELLGELAEQLRDRGFGPDDSEDAPICRYKFPEGKLDVMPTDGQILGFENRWFRHAFDSATKHPLPNALTIRVASAPCFLATKLEAFGSRGEEDYLGHKDVEDVLAVLGGRAEVVEEVRRAHPEVRDYLIGEAERLLNTPEFCASIPGHLPGEDPQRVLQRLRDIAELVETP